MGFKAEADDVFALWMGEAKATNDRQAALVATLTPGTQAHRYATGVLLMLRDSLFEISEARALLSKTSEG